MERLRESVRAVLRESFDGQFSCEQNAGTAFSLFLTWRLTPADAVNPVLYGRPKVGAKELLARQGLQFVDREILVDFVVVEQESETRWFPLVACESEMYAQHGVGYSLDAWNSGYSFDCWKLLHIPAPILLFTARLASSRFAELEKSLTACASDYHRYWAARQVLVVLLPTSPRDLPQTRLGIGRSDGGIEFEDLGS